MSERMLKPRRSRRWRAASTSFAGPTTTVVSPCASLTSTSPGTRSKLMCQPSVGRSRSDPADLVRGRDAGHHLLVEADDALHQRLRPGWAARHVDVDRHDLVDTL